MGPYTTVEVAEADPTMSCDHPTTSDATAEEAIDPTLAMLRRVQGSLRTAPGINAFLAVDVGIPLAAVDAATQSVRLARSSNAVAFVLPAMGDNLGVGVEVGAVLEDRCVDSDRLIVIHEESVTSAMLDAVTRRWEARVATYVDEAELVDVLRRFVAEIMYRESTGELPRKSP